MAAHSLIFDDRKLMTVEEYLHSSFEPDAELVDGRIEERNVGEVPHGRWQDAIQAWFRSNPGWGLRALPEVRVQVTAQNFRVPDVTVLRKEQLDGRIVTDPPVAVFEVVSPDDRYPDVMKKLREYQAMGIQNIFVVDPQTQGFSVYRKNVLQPAITVERLAGVDHDIEAAVEQVEIGKLF